MAEMLKLFLFVEVEGLGEVVTAEGAGAEAGTGAVGGDATGLTGAEAGT